MVIPRYACSLLLDYPSDAVERPFFLIPATRCPDPEGGYTMVTADFFFYAALAILVFGVLLLAMTYQRKPRFARHL